jgi:sigma-B regulation protein RsbU (phosphoserine phosphatase)
MAKLERYVHASFKPEHFLTLLLGQIDLASGMLTYCNAGHMQPIVFSRDGSFEELQGADPALNIASCHRFQLFQRALKKGDLALIYTDGLTEQENDQGEDFGRERMIACAREHLEESLENIGRSVLKAQRSFGGHTHQQDDTTLILIRREDDHASQPQERAALKSQDVAITIEGEPME